MKFSQAPAALVMVRPKTFGFNPQTADTNTFQRASGEGPGSIQEKALQEFDKMVDLLRSNDVDVLVVDDSTQPVKPDAVFPNNWISFHHDGTVVLYPMLAENRRLERNNPVIDSVARRYQVNNPIDLSGYEKQNRFLEGTGSIVFDYVNKIAYASRSPRTDETVLHDLANKLGFKSIVFDAVDEHGQPVYHTNVLLCIGTGFVILCLDAIRKDEDQEELLASFASTHHQVIAISFAQMKQFAGNMLEIKSKTGELFILMSQRAYHSLLPGQLDALTTFADPVPVNIPTIEDHGGGSVRCMVAGIFNPPR